MNPLLTLSLLIAAGLLVSRLGRLARLPNVTAFLVGGLLHRFFGFTLREGMLIATPAGANDMALISGDLDVHSPDVVVLQIVRMVIVISLFPQLIHLLVGLLP